MTCMQTLPELYARVVQSDKQLVSPCVKDTTCYMPPPPPHTHQYLSPCHQPASQQNFLARLEAGCAAALCCCW
jgi:hypothetical protein